MKIDNKQANNILIKYRNTNNPQELMDAISDVKNYELNNHYRQGYIRKSFVKELISDQFLINIDDIVSIFWKGVFENINSVKLWGEEVEIIEDGKAIIRKTNNNPIHYLRKCGYYAVRNYITSLYKKNLRQCCVKCGNTINAKTSKECAKCGGDMHTIYKYSEMNNDTFISNKIESQNIIDNQNIDDKFKNMFSEFTNTVLKDGTRAFQIMMIFTDPAYSVNMCSECSLCDATTFDFTTCTNYNENIGRYLGVNKTMVANKVNRIRKALVTFISEYQEDDDAEYILSLLPKKWRVPISA